MLTVLASLCVLAPQGRLDAPVVVNEFAYTDDVAPDDLEFVELFNRSTLPVDLGGWSIVTESATGPGPGYVIPIGVAPLPAGGHFVLASLGVPNVSLVIGTQDLFGNGTYSLTLKDAVGQVVDTVVYEAHRGIWDPLLVEGRGIVGRAVMAQTRPTSWSRWRDGRDTNDNGCDFRLLPWTPGATNDRAPLQTATDDFEGYAPGAAVAGFGGARNVPRAIDPSTVPPFNPNTIPASPQGGRAAVFWDPATAGHQCMHLAEPAVDATFEAWVYFDATPAVGSDLQMWSVGFGSTGSAYAFPDPARNLGQTENGNTGVAWTLVHDASGVVLYLVDHGRGGSGFTVLGSIPIQAGSNDGWRRLRLRFDVDTVEGDFGGTLGNCDGVSLGGRRERCGPLGFYVGYRAAYASPAGRRPFTCDALTLALPTANSASVAYYGEAVPNSVARPVFATSGFPRAGCAGFELRARDLRPNAPCVFLLGDAALAVPLLAFGAQPDATLLVNPVLHLGVGANAAGEWSLPLSPPATAVGTRVFAQLVEWDPALTFTLPIAHTQAVDLGIGN